MTTAHVHSLTQGEIARSANSAKSAAANKAMTVVKAVQRMMIGTGLIGWLKQAIRSHRSRQQLANLDARLLRDIGLTEAQRYAELAKPFWKTQRLER